MNKERKNIPNGLVEKAEDRPNKPETIDNLNHLKKLRIRLKGLFREDPIRALDRVSALISTGALFAALALGGWGYLKYTKIKQKTRTEILQIAEQKFPKILNTMGNSLFVALNPLLTEMAAALWTMERIKLTVIPPPSEEGYGDSTLENIRKFHKRDEIKLPGTFESQLNLLEEQPPSERPWREALPLEEFLELLTELTNSLKEFISFGEEKIPFSSMQTDDRIMVASAYSRKDRPECGDLCHGYDDADQTGKSYPVIMKLEKDLGPELAEALNEILTWIGTLLAVAGIFGIAAPRITNKLIVLPLVRDLESKNQSLEAERAEKEELLREVTKFANQMEALAEERSKQLIHADRLVTLGTLSAGVAHEINNPTCAIGNNIQILFLFLPYLKKAIEGLIQKKADDSGKLNSIKTKLPEIIEAIREGVKRISKIVDGLKDFAREKESKFEPHDITKCIQKALDLTEFNETLKNGKVEVATAKSLPQVIISEGEIQQVLINLFTNAAHAMEDNKERGENVILTISATHNQAKNEIELKITDNGKGMNREILEKIFTPFFTTKRGGQGSAGDGTGLGLAICHGIIEKHHGTITAESTPGKGTTFTITLPLDPEQVDRRNQGGKPIPGGMRKKDQ